MNYRVTYTPNKFIHEYILYIIVINIYQQVNGFLHNRTTIRKLGLDNETNSVSLMVSECPTFLILWRTNLMFLNMN